jgi:hypothetical protein
LSLSLLAFPKYEIDMKHFPNASFIGVIFDLAISMTPNFITTYSGISFKLVGAFFFQDEISFEFCKHRQRIF